MKIAIKRRDLREIQGCEEAAHDEGMRGPSPLTTYDILSRHAACIEVFTAEEAAQVADALTYGTSELYVASRTLDRIYTACMSFDGAGEVYRENDRRCFEELAKLIRERGQGDQPLAQSANN